MVARAVSGPAIALGTVQFGLAYGIAGLDAPVAESEVRKILDAAERAGITRLDTAAAYGDIEARLGKLVGDRAFTVVSKIPALPADLGCEDAVAFVEQAISRSHDRLGGLLKALLFHDAAMFENGRRASLWLRASERCQALGIELGISGYDPDVLSGMTGLLASGPVQLPASALDQRYCRVADALASSEITLRSLFLQGLLVLPAHECTRRLPSSAAAIGAWHRWLDMHNLEPLTGAIAVAKAMPAQFCVFGVDSLAQLEEIVIAWSDTNPRVAPELACDDLTVIDPRAWHAAGK